MTFSMVALTRSGFRSTMNTFKWIYGYSSKYWATLVFVMVCMAVDAAAAAGFANLVKPMIDGALTAESGASAWNVAFLITLILSLRGVAGYLSDTRMAHVGRMTLCNIRDDVFAAHLSAVETEDTFARTGDRVMDIAYASEQVAFSVADAVKVVVLDGLTAAFCVLLMFYLSPLLACVMFVAIPSMAVIAASSARRVKQLSKAYQDHISDSNTAVIEACSSSRYIKVFGAAEVVRQRFMERSVQIAKIGMRLSSVASAASSATQISGGIALSLVVVAASGALPIDASRVSAGTFFAVVTAMGIAVPSMRRLSGVYSSIQKAVVAADGLRKILGARSADSSCMRRLRSGGVDVEFVSVGVTYVDGTQALSEVSVRCRAGEVTLIVGESGCGKSSLLSLVPRFRIPTSGSVLVDGHEIGSYSQGSIFDAIGWVGASTGILSGTVRENIAFGGLHATSTDDIVHAARLARAWEFIEHLPDGLETRLGVSGRDLSEGQKQRLLLARAILKMPGIVLLDESTSALDRTTERAVGDSILEAFKGSTVIMATHRLDLAGRAHQIVVMEHGMVAEAGTHEELLARRAAYWRLASKAVS